MISSTHAGIPIDQLFLDLRRGISADVAARVRAAAPYLEPLDREMVLAVLDRGQTAAAVGRIGNQNPRQVRRKVRRVYARISSPEFQFVAQRVDSWGGTRRKVALASFLHGMSLRQAASSLGLSMHLVRQHIAAIRNQIDLSRHAAQGNPLELSNQRAA
jgi:hypothetical protein